MKIFVDELPKEPIGCLFYRHENDECTLDEGYCALSFDDQECPYLKVNEVTHEEDISAINT